MKRLLILTLFLFYGITSLAFADKNPKDIINKAKKKYRELTALQADFEQVFKWELAGETQTVKGKIFLSAGNNYRIETDNQVVVTDGTTVWTYSKQTDQVIIDLLNGSEEGQLPKDLLFRYSEEYNPKYIGEEKIDGKKVYVLNLLPKDDEAFITEMKIWVDASDWFTRKIEQRDINDNINTYFVRNIKDNEPIDAALFQFEVPEAAEVVDLRETE